MLDINIVQKGLCTEQECSCFQLYCRFKPYMNLSEIANYNYYWPQKKPIDIVWNYWY